MFLCVNDFSCFPLICGLSLLRWVVTAAALLSKYVQKGVFRRLYLMLSASLCEQPPAMLVSL